MIGTLIKILPLVLLPALLFVLWSGLSGREGMVRAIGGRWPWLVVTAMLLALIGAIVFSVRFSHNPETVYVPARMGPDGVVIPGRFEPKPPDE